MSRSTPPGCGDYYESALPGGSASSFLVISENLWNDTVGDSVVVPIFDSLEPEPPIRTEIKPGKTADSTLVQNQPHKFLGQRLGSCPTDEWNLVRIGVRIHLDIDRRIAKSQIPATNVTRTNWWPHQNEVRFATHPSVPQQKMFGVVTSDQWNSRSSTTYCSAVRLTSKRKDWREGWEVSIDGGVVVSGDIYPLRYDDIDPEEPSDDYPGHLTKDQSAEIAAKQKITMSLK